MATLVFTASSMVSDLGRVEYMSFRFILLQKFSFKEQSCIIIEKKIWTED